MNSTHTTPRFLRLLLAALRVLLLIFGVAFAIVYLCMLGTRLTANSFTAMQHFSLWQEMEPALEQTVGFFEAALRGELGSVTARVPQYRVMPTTEYVARAFLASTHLLLVALGLATVVGIAAGGLAAARRHSVLSLSTLTLTVVGVSIPSFFLALLVQVADIRFYQRTGIGLFPVFGISSARTESLLPQVVAPALVLAARPLAQIARVTFVSLSDILGQDFIRTARAKGLAGWVVFLRHALRNAGVGIVTAVIISLRFALGSLPVVEIFFGWPGIGAQLFEGVFGGRAQLVVPLALALGLTLLLINLLLDFVYRLIDPRLRGSADGGDT